MGCKFALVPVIGNSIFAGIALTSLVVYLLRNDAGGVLFACLSIVLNAVAVTIFSLLLFRKEPTNE